MHIQLNDRRLVFNAYRDLKERTMRDHNCSEKEIFRWCDDTACRNLTWRILENKYKDVLPVTERCYAFLGLEIGINELSTSSFESRIERCMSIPYVRESATGLAVEAFIKRLELACQVEADRKKRNKRKKAVAEQTPDFSVLDAFRDDDFQNVINMNNEWLAHHDDPEYDHGAPMYWFPDLDQALESTIQNVKQQLINIAMMYNYPEQQRKAWNILYTWKEYISSK